MACYLCGKVAADGQIVFGEEPSRIEDVCGVCLFNCPTGGEEGKCAECGVDAGVELYQPQGSETAVGMDGSKQFGGNLHTELCEEHLDEQKVDPSTFG